MPPERNICSGPFGAIYHYYTERLLLARLVLGAMGGVDPRPFYRSLRYVVGLPDGATVLDVPCGGGVALRGLRPGQRVRWLGRGSRQHSYQPPRRQPKGFGPTFWADGTKTALKTRPTRRPPRRQKARISRKNSGQ